VGLTVIGSAWLRRLLIIQVVLITLVAAAAAMMISRSLTISIAPIF